MARHLSVTFGLCDSLNPRIGYQLRIEDAETGTPILFTARDPRTHYDLLTVTDVQRVISYYING